MKKEIPNTNENRSFKADMSQIETFFRVLFRNAKEGFISLRGFGPDKKILFPPEGYSLSDPNLILAAERLANLVGETPKGVFCSPISTFKSTSKATENHLASGIAIIVDLDETNPKVAREVLEAKLGPPTMIVMSGGDWVDPSSGKVFPRLHLYWRLSTPTALPEEHKRLALIQKNIAQLVGGDPSASNPVHPMRIPGSWHTKAAPRLCRIVKVVEEAEISLERAEAALEPYSPKLTNEKFESGNQNNTAYGMRAMEKELLTLSQAAPGNRNSSLNQAAFSLGQLVANGQLNEPQVFEQLFSTAVSLGLSDEEARQTINSGIEGGKRKPRVKQNGKDLLKKFRFIQAGELEVKSPEWIIENILETSTLSLLFGDPGTGKTYVALDMVACIATGVRWGGAFVKQSSVFYIAGEGFSGISRRLKAWSIYRGQSLDDAPLFISEQPGELMDPENIKMIAESIKEFALIHGTPKLVVVDTLARNFGNGDESNTKDMSAFVSNLDQYIRIPFNCCVLLIHHTGHSDKYRARGSMALKGALDAEYLIQKENGVVKMTNTKMKDAETPKPICFRLKSLGIGVFDEKQKEITSAILELIEYQGFDFGSIQKLIPQEGINQGNLLDAIHTHLQMGRESALKRLNEGNETYWTIKKGANNSNVYKAVFGFSPPKEPQTENLSQEVN